MTAETLDFFASCARSLEPFLAQELSSLGCTDPVSGRSGVAFRADRTTAMKVCLWSRVASRVLQSLRTFDGSAPDDIYAAASDIAWEDLFGVNRSFAVAVAGTSCHINNTQFAGLRVKDAIADRFRRERGQRPNVDAKSPDVIIHLALGDQQCHLSLDWSGEPLHRRGFRTEAGAAPLKETLAAALLIRAGWPENAPQRTLLDPMCGSGTIVIEAAQMAAGLAPGKDRSFAFEALHRFDQEAWTETKRLAQVQADQQHTAVRLYARDLDPQVLQIARRNARRAGVEEMIEFKAGDVLQLPPPADSGLIVTNPPYGERLSNESELIKFLSLLGATLRDSFGGWKLALLSARDDLTPRLGLRASRITRCFNGKIPCQLLEFEIAENAPATLAEDLANRLRKNLRQLKRWQSRNEIGAFRVYDADLPDYALAVDIYDTDLGRHLYVQEYAAPSTVDPVRAERRLRSALATLTQVLEVPAARLHFRQRARQRREQQYQRQDSTETFFQVNETQRKFRVNLDDYLDTGLFLDHRPLRQRIQEQAAGARVLNLYCYTGSITVAAALGGARQTVSVDLSRRYLEWAEANLRLNGFESQHFRHLPLPAKGNALVRDDCAQWLEKAAADPSLRFELIVLDPPTFSNSKKMETTLDIQRDHPALIQAAAALLSPNGQLYFSSNRRGFKLELDALHGLQCKDITRQTLDPDFQRPRPPHKCWLITITPEPGAD